MEAATHSEPKVGSRSLAVGFPHVAVWIVIGFLVIFAVYRYPRWDGDSAYFIVPALDYSQNRTLESPYAKEIGLDDHYTYHGPLSPILLGGLNIWKSYDGLRFVTTVLQGLTLLIFGFVLSHFRARYWHTMNRAKYSLVSSLSIVTLASSIMHSGRPEHIASFLLVSGILLYIIVPTRFQIVVAGVTFGAMVTANPICAVLAGSLWLAFRIQMQPSRKLLIGVFQEGMWAAVAVTSVLMLYPYSTSALLAGLRKAAEIQAQRTDTERWVYYWFLEPTRFCMGLFAVVSMVTAALVLQKIQENRLRRRIGYVCLLLFSGLVYYWCVRVPPRSYVFQVVCPAAILWMIHYLAISETSYGRVRPTTAVVMASVAIAVSLAASALGFVRFGLVWSIFVQCAVRVQTARVEAIPFDNSAVSEVGLSSGLFSLFRSTAGKSLVSPGSVVTRQLKRYYVHESFIPNLP